MLNIVGLLCEDIREEANGQHSIIGVMPDNFQSPAPFPFALPKLGIYLRVNVGVTDIVEPMEVFIEAPMQEPRKLTDFDPAFIAQAQREGADNGTPIVGMLVKAVTGSFPIFSEGMVKVVVRTATQSVDAVVLNVRSFTPAPSA